MKSSYFLNKQDIDNGCDSINGYQDPDDQLHVHIMYNKADNKKIKAKLERGKKIIQARIEFSFGAQVRTEQLYSKGC